MTCATMKLIVKKITLTFCVLCVLSVLLVMPLLAGGCGCSGPTTTSSSGAKITEKTYKTNTDTYQAAAKKLSDLKSSTGTQGAMRETANWVKGQPGVNDAGISGDSVWISYDAGYSSVIIVRDPGLN